MFFSSIQSQRIEQVPDLPQPFLSITARMLANGCARSPAVDRAGKIGHFAQLVEAGAWTDAALLLAELELPEWEVTCLAYENGRWICSLSKQADLGIDATAHGCHALLPMAILLALIEAHRSADADKTMLAARPHIGATADVVVCCENFA